MLEWLNATSTWGGMRILDVVFGFGNGCFWTILVFFTFFDMGKLWELNRLKVVPPEEIKKPLEKKRISDYF